MNRHPDSVKPLILKGDKVLVNRDESKKTNDIAYNTATSIEFDKKGSIVTTEQQNVITRKTSFFNTVQIADEYNSSTEAQTLLTQKHHYSPTTHSQDGVRNAYTHASSSWTTTFVIRTFLQA